MLLGKLVADPCSSLLVKPPGGIAPLGSSFNIKSRFSLAHTLADL